MGEAIGTGSTIAGYRLANVLGRGGMGVVYRAEDPELDRPVAVKLIAPELARDEGFRERFRREARLAAAIEHPNAIPIYETGVTDDGVMYLAMRYVEGTDMRSLIRSEGRLDPARAARLVEQVAGALDEAHAHGLVHRDVKPGNVLVSQRRGAEHPYLTDFGLTKDVAAASDLTATGQWVGTVDYASPEQIEGKRVDALTDVYALGCVLFEAVTGRVPFERDSELAKLFAHANEDPPQPSTVAEGVPAAIDDVILRSLAKDADDRFPSAGDLGRAAAAAAAGRAVAEPERTVAAGAAAAAPGAVGDGPPVAETVESPAPGTVPAARPGPEPPPLAPERTSASARPAETESPQPPPTEAAPPTPATLEEPSPPTGPASSGRRAAGARRRLLAGAGAAAVIAAVVGAGFATGVIGGGGEDDPAGATGGAVTSAGASGDGDNGGGAGDGSGGAAAEVEYELETPGQYSVEVPVGWELDELGPEEPRPDGQFRTRWEDPDRLVRLGINRFPDEVGDLGGFAREQRVNNVGAEEADFRVHVEPEPVSVGSKDAYRFVFERDLVGLGHGRAFAYFFELGGDTYRVQGAASDTGGAEAREVAREVARHATRTLRPAGG